MMEGSVQIMTDPRGPNTYEVQIHTDPQHWFKHQHYFRALWMFCGDIVIENCRSGITTTDPTGSLTLAFSMVKKAGPLWYVYLMKGWSGMRTPMRLVSGLKLRLRRGVRVKTRVTGPGNRLSSNSVDTVTCQSQDSRMYCTYSLADPDPQCYLV